MPERKGKKREGFHSAAGLVRYFDAEEEVALKVDPRLVIGLCIGIAVTVELVKRMWPL
ncbi:MAG: preprotein translocase subunit Sec61beta [Candidatus Thermoplasmatota archaeon]|nr:preprotein translocase subunit Sec61beta [Candidatus Thermoplasmatota archaeon]MDI6855903.1 preprotein translocase subunit Sec61beta [Candidatus Thermoplasmatota archaeon]MDI6887808.1 preprotein translocase subunit Sec61beta [Candidatus Thermoplasmatota archaeon]